MSRARRQEVDNMENRANLQMHIADLKQLGKVSSTSCVCEQEMMSYGELPF